MSRAHYSILILIVVIALWALSFIGAHSPANWAAESKVFYWTIPVMAVVAVYIRMSKLSLTLMGIYLVLHIVGMHFNYGEVPFGDLLGRLLHTDRNMYDRFVHFSFGLLMFYPIREVLLRFKQTRTLFAYLVPVGLIAAFSSIYEIMEWRTVSGLSTSVGYLFIGGNDPFDGQKDMTVAIIGAAIAMLIVLVVTMLRTKTFWQDMRDSFRLSKSALRIE